MYYQNNISEYYARKQNLQPIYFILCPEYKAADYEKAKDSYKRGDEYEIKTYGALSDAINRAGLSEFTPDEQEIVKDFMRTIQQYTLNQNTFYMDRACGRFVNRIEYLKKNNKP